jgi:hypothetical protein
VLESVSIVVQNQISAVFLRNTNADTSADYSPGDWEEILLVNFIRKLGYLTGDIGRGDDESE